MTLPAPEVGGYPTLEGGVEIRGENHVDEERVIDGVKCLANVNGNQRRTQRGLSLMKSEPR